MYDKYKKSEILFVCRWFLHMLNVFDLVRLLTVKRAPPKQWIRGGRGKGKWLNLINTSIAVECPLWERESEGLPDTFPYSVFVWGTPNCKYACRYSTHYIYPPYICIYTRYICCCGHRINQSTGVKIYDLKHNHNNCLPLSVCVCVCWGSISCAYN